MPSLASPIHPNACQMEIPDNTIHVWRISLDSLCANTPIDCWNVLSPDERLRAERFRFKRERDNFIICRGGARARLAPYLNIHPAELEIATTTHGKPFLPKSPQLQFNISHTKRTALLAVTREFPVGIDIEEIDPDFPHLDAARNFFLPHESDHLASLPINARPRAFYTMWCSREAAVKATGSGFQTAPDSIEIHPTGESAILPAPSPTNDPPVRVWLENLHLGDPEIAFIAHQGPRHTNIRLQNG